MSQIYPSSVWELPNHRTERDLPPALLHNSLPVALEPQAKIYSYSWATAIYKYCKIIKIYQDSIWKHLNHPLHVLNSNSSLVREGPSPGHHGRSFITFILTFRGVSRLSNCNGIDPLQTIPWGLKNWVPSGKLTVCCWKWPFIVDLPIPNGDFP